MANSFLPLALAGAIFSTYIADAQQADFIALGSKTTTTVAPERALGYVNRLHTKAVRNFKEDFKSATNESWSESKECFRVSFVQDAVHTMVDYYKNGHWRSTIRIFSEQQMPKDIRWTIKLTYIDYKILTVTELTYGKTLSYFVKLEGTKDLKTIRLMNGDMEVVEEYTR